MLAIRPLSSDSTIFRRSVRVMGNMFEISVVGNDPIWADARINDAINEIERVDKLLSAFSDDSIINNINRNAGITPVKVNAEIFGLIDRALQISDLTYGTFDITYCIADKTIDTETVAIKTSKKATVAGYKNVVIDAAKQTVFLKETNMRISFAANSKGYAADRAKYVLQLQDVSNGVINAGGDLLTWGMQPGNVSWTIAAADPDQVAQPFADVNISNMAVVTSFNTQNVPVPDHEKMVGKADLKNGFPVSKIKSVSVVSPTAEFSAAMATPIMYMGINGGLYLIDQLNQLACIIVDDHSRVYTSKNVSV